MRRIGNKTIVIASLALFLLLAIGAGYGWLKLQARPAGKSGTIIEINADSFSELTLQLSNKNLIRSKLYFAWIWGNKKTLPATGYYSVGGTSAKELKQILLTRPNIVKLTVPEGFSAGQIAQRLDKEGLPGKEFITLALPLEGKLFPETYFLRKDVTAQQIIDKLTGEYQAKTSELNVTSDNINLASIIEREAKKDEERAKIAAVYLNRLAQGMKLEADPTVQYGRDLALLKGNGWEDKKLWQPLSAGDTRSITSSYNTYINTGLPPGPICNPGLPSIKAAQNPEAGFVALYFFHDAGGVIHFSATFAAHQSAIRQFGL